MPATKITVRNDGPLLIEGDLEVIDALGKAYGLAGRTNIALCRCGHSEKKPFCDGTHRRQGFQSACEAHDLPPMQPKA
jgi:CDGSH-type Zn-finger protein